MLSLAGEYAVASELCREVIYAQLTLAHRKRVDLLVATEKAMLNIQVKTKQNKEWPLIKGISGDDILLIFVDYENKPPGERPDFYILTARDWDYFVKHGWISKFIGKNNKNKENKYELNEENCPIHLGRDDKPNWKGCNLDASDITRCKEKWDKVHVLLEKK